MIPEQSRNFLHFVHIFSADLWFLELVEIVFIFFYALANCYI